MKKFYQLNRVDRLKELVKKGLITDELFLINENLTDDQLAIFTENTVGQFHLPLGLVNGLKVNGKSYLIPIATFEPSVVAALNKATHYVNSGEGIIVTGEKLPVTGQIFTSYHGDPKEINQKLAENKSFLTDQGNFAVSHLVERGGGITNIKFEFEHNVLISSVEVDVKEAMGANLVDTIVERLAPLIAETVQGEVISAILSNLPTGTPFKAQAKVPINLIGIDTAKKIVQLAQIATFNNARAATNNKGVMNGLIGAVIASGNDDRAVSSALYHGQNLGKDRSFTHWRVSKTDLIGEFSGYLPLGTVGGAITTHPDAIKGMKLLNVKNSTELAHVFMAVGLASNFSALFALVTDGIQKGHMRLQAKSIALSMGVKPQDLQDVVNQMVTLNKFDTLTVQKIMESRNNNDRNK